MALAISLAGCGGSSGGNTNADLAQAANGDLAGLPFGAACTKDAECATGKCFIGGAMSFCTMPCTAATQATDCPNPPTSGTCNKMNFCKP